MTTITIRTDDSIKNILTQNAKMNGLTLTGYINLVFRKHIVGADDVDNDKYGDADFISEKRLQHELAIAEERLDNPKAKYVDAKAALRRLGKKYGL
jgi:hypothetical protein